MSKIKDLASAHERYTITLEHKLDPAPAIKAVVTILGDNNTYTKKVSTLFSSAATLEEAEEIAVSKGISMILGNKQTKELIDSAEMLDISFVDFATKTGTAVRATVIVFKDGKPYRQASSISTGEKAETEALKNAINKVLGVK